MALWLVRTGRHGEHEARFLETNRVYLTWGEHNEDLSKFTTAEQFQDAEQTHHPERAKKAVIHYASQARRFVHEINLGDWVVVPSKTKPAINFAEIIGAYVFDPSAPRPYFHYRNVKWVGRDIPRSNFDQDLLYSFGAFSTVCQIERNDAEARVRAMAAGGWKSSSRLRNVPSVSGEALSEESVIDLERLARDQIAQLIEQKFKGHGLARLVEAILQAQGYTTFLSPEGPDKGIDILGAPGPLGFGDPRLCVQVKSGDSPVDSATLNQLIGAMQNVHAEQGLLVSWGGFKSSVDKERPAQFFRVRLWDQDALIAELLATYEKLDEALRAELPLKRIWTITPSEDEE